MACIGELWFNELLTICICYDGHDDDDGDDIQMEHICFFLAF